MYELCGIEWKSKKQQVCTACNTQIYLQEKESGDENKQNSYNYIFPRGIK